VRKSVVIGRTLSGSFHELVRLISAPLGLESEGGFVGVGAYRLDPVNQSKPWRD
jgi:hypothetical protein